MCNELDRLTKKLVELPYEDEIDRIAEIRKMAGQVTEHLNGCHTCHSESKQKNPVLSWMVQIALSFNSTPYFDVFLEVALPGKWYEALDPNVGELGLFVVSTANNLAGINKSEALIRWTNAIVLPLFRDRTINYHCGEYNPYAMRFMAVGSYIDGVMTAYISEEAMTLWHREVYLKMCREIDFNQVCVFGDRVYEKLDLGFELISSAFRYGRVDDLRELLTRLPLPENSDTEPEIRRNLNSGDMGKSILAIEWQKALKNRHSEKHKRSIGCSVTPVEHLVQCSILLIPYYPGEESVVIESLHRVVSEELYWYLESWLSIQLTLMNFPQQKNREALELRQAIFLFLSGLCEELEKLSTAQERFGYLEAAQYTDEPKINFSQLFRPATHRRQPPYGNEAVNDFAVVFQLLWPDNPDIEFWLSFCTLTSCYFKASDKELELLSDKLTAVACPKDNAADIVKALTFSQ